MLFQNGGPMTTLRVGLVLRISASASASRRFQAAFHLRDSVLEDLEHHGGGACRSARHLAPERHDARRHSSAPFAQAS
jgi:hypothetical protein